MTAERRPASLAQHSRIARFGTVFWIILVTVLLWIYADLEFTGDQDMKVTLRLTTGESANVVLLSDAEHEISFTVTGSRFLLEDFRREMIDRGNVIVYNASGEYEKGGKSRAVPAAELLSRAFGDEDLNIEGLTIHKCSPESIELSVDRIQEIPDVPVTLTYTGAEVPAPPQPRKVKVLIPSSKSKKLSEAIKNPQVSLTTVPVDLSAYQPGKHKVIADVNPVLDGMKFEVDPKSVEFEIEITSPTQTKSMKIAINIITPSKWGQKGDTTWNDYILTLSPDSSWRQELQIAGSQQFLKPENVLAFVRLTDEDKKPVESWLQREVIVTFPPEMKLRLVGTPPKVKFRLEKRKSIVPAP